VRIINNDGGRREREEREREERKRRRRSMKDEGKPSLIGMG